MFAHPLLQPPPRLPSLRQQLAQLPCPGSGLGARHTSHVTRHTSHVTRHTSHVTRHTSHVTRHSLTRASDRVQLVSVRDRSLPPSSSIPRSLALCTPWSVVDSRAAAPWVAPPAITSIADASRYFHLLLQLNSMTSLGPFVNDIVSHFADDRFRICV